MEPSLEIYEYGASRYHRAFRTCWPDCMFRRSVLPSIARYLFVEDNCSEKRDNMPTMIYYSSQIILKHLFGEGSRHTVLASKRSLEIHLVEEGLI